MEQREGVTPSDEPANAPLPIMEVLCRALDLATTLNQVHREGRAHGHIKPVGIPFAAGMQMADTGAFGVTPYTAPEQLRGTGDARSDIFAFGAVVYELATGRRAFAGATEGELRAAILEKQ